jgi:hypothetical protein
MLALVYYMALKMPQSDSRKTHVQKKKAQNAPVFK